MNIMTQHQSTAMPGLSEFETIDGITYLDSANSGPRLRSTISSEYDALRSLRHAWMIDETHWQDQIEYVREASASLLSVSTDNMAFVPSASYGLSVAANNLHICSGSNIVLLKGQYPSNQAIWERKAAQVGAELRSALRVRANWTASVLSVINHNTAVVAIPGCHWTDGSTIELEAIAERSRRCSAALVLDLSQSMGAVELPIRSIDPDFIVSVGYKWLLGPYGLSYLYVANRHLTGQPIEETWHTGTGYDSIGVAATTPSKNCMTARRFDAGQCPCFSQIGWASESMRQVLSWSPAFITSRLRELTDAIGLAAEHRGMRPVPKASRSPHFIGLELGSVAARLSKQLKARGIITSARGGYLRVAPHLHTSEKDIQILFDAIGAY